MRIGTLLLAAALAGCSGPAPKPGPAPKAEDPKAAVPKPAPIPAPTPVPKPDPLPPPPPAPDPTPKPARVEAKPVAVDLSKFKGPSENADLFGFNDGDGKLFFYTAGTIELAAKVPADGEYEVTVTASCDEAKGEKAKWTLAVDGQVTGGEQVCTTVDAKEYRLKMSLKAGERKLGLKFLNDLFKEGEYDLNFYVHGVVIKPAR